MLKRRRFKQTTSLEDRLLMDARRKRERACRLPPGTERDTLLERARQDETIANVSEWITSPGLQTPK
jgi:hypothetical protein